MTAFDPIQGVSKTLRYHTVTIVVASSLIVLTSSDTMAAEPLLEKVDVFTARTGGYASYRIPGIVVTGKGTLLAYCEARKSNKGD
jgi:hypothetical protein